MKAALTGKLKKSRIGTGLTPERRRWIGVLLLLGAWVWIACLLKGWPYAIVVALPVFAAWIVFPKVLLRARFLLLALSVGAMIVLGTPVINGWREFTAANVAAMADPKESVTNVLTPNSGLNVLPDPVLQMLSLLRAHEVDSYRLSGRLYGDQLLMQRITEAAWPRKMEEAAHYMFQWGTEYPLEARCSEVDHRKDIVLVYCP